MKDAYITIYTKEYGKQEFTEDGWFFYDKSKVTYHRTKGPALEWAEGFTEWRSNGVLHREGGPAIESVEGYKAWWFKGKLHRIGGPAKEYSTGCKVWYVNGKLHRIDGPAREWADGNKEWWVDGVEYTEEEFKGVVDKYKLLPRSIRLTHNLWWVREL